MAETRSPILQGTLDLMVLKTLEQLGTMHGFAIARRIEQAGQDAVILNQGTIYLCLMRLVQKNWVTTRWGTSENNRRAKFYALTRAGRKQLKAETERWEKLSGMMGRVLHPVERG
jgi:transcriptional regulator